MGPNRQKHRVHYTREPWTLSELCTHQLATLCAKDEPDEKVFDERHVMKYLSTSEQKFQFLLVIYGTYQLRYNSPLGYNGDVARKTKVFKLLTNDWILMVAFLKLQDQHRIHLHRIFQGLINSKKLPIHTFLVNKLIKPLESPTSQFSVKAIYEILLFATFLLEAGWFGECERLLYKVLNKIGNVYIEDNEDQLTFQYFGPYLDSLGVKLPTSLKNKKNVYSAHIEIKLILLKCLLEQPCRDNFKKAKILIFEMNLNENSLSNIKQEDQLAIKVVFQTLCSMFHYSQSEYTESLKCALQGVKFLLNYGSPRENLCDIQGEPIHGIKIKSTITTDCIRHASKALLATGDHESAEKLMEIAMNMHKMEWHGRQIYHDIYFATLLQDYGEILQTRHKWKKSHNCFSLGFDVSRKDKKNNFTL